MSIFYPNIGKHSIISSLFWYPVCFCSNLQFMMIIIIIPLIIMTSKYWQCCILYAQANMLARKFYMCSDHVKINLFRAYCTSLYTSPLWAKFKKGSMHKLQVAYNDCITLKKKNLGGAISFVMQVSTLSRLYWEIWCTNLFVDWMILRTPLSCGWQILVSVLYKTSHPCGNIGQCFSFYLNVCIVPCLCCVFFLMDSDNKVDNWHHCWSWSKKPNFIFFIEICVFIVQLHKIFTFGLVWSLS